ncbi:MAG: DUF4340 domain-containing protein, partial [Gemmataceae bacterium]|nr:DUF4340 domain-containing protein [Gemmataceae bacterium]
KTDKLKDVAVKVDELRDPLVARFKTDDARRLEIVHHKDALVLKKEKDQWKIEKPTLLDAETQPINELLDKLAGLRASDKDVRYGIDPKTVGLDPPRTVVKLTLEDGKGSDPEKKTRELVFHIGTTDKEKGKLFISRAGWPRVNVVADDLLKLLDRPVLAYRQRRVLDLASSDLAKIDIVRSGEEYSLERKDGAWQLSKPTTTKADVVKADGLAADLARLETTEFITDSPKDEDLDKLYGLAKPSLRVTLNFTDAKKPAQVLTIGKQRTGKDDSYARLDNGPIFVVKKDLREALDRDSLAYRPLQLWQIPAADLQEVRIGRNGSAFTLTRKDKTWHISGPFEASALPQEVERLIDEAAQVRAEKYIAHAVKETDKYGFDKPYLSVEVIAKGDKEPAKHKLRVGKPVEKDDKFRYAQLDGDAAVFTVGEKTVSALAKDALDLLDKDLVNVASRAIQRVQSKRAGGFTLEQKKEEWFVIGSPAPEFKADDDAVQSFLRPWTRLRAERVAAYGSKIDWKQYGLDQPEAAVVATVLVGEEKDKKTVEHTLLIGKEAGNGQRYARLDQQEKVVVLDATAAKELTRTYLDFVNHRLLRFDLDTVTAIARQSSSGDVELLKRDDQWYFGKPERRADDLTVNEMLDRLFRLKAERIAAYPAADLAKFGLDQPAAVVEIKLTDPTGAPKSHVVKVGKEADLAGKPGNGERFALVDKGEAVAVLSAELSKQLLAPPLYFADRNLATISTADGVVVERGSRKLTFALIDNFWKMTAPVKADAEDGPLDDLVKELRRLRAEEIIADKGDPRTYEFDRPAAVWTLTAGDKEVLALIVGKAEAVKDKDAKPRRYAKLAKSDTVFLLSAKLSGKLLEEYRSRKPWTALDAVAIEQLSFGGPAPFTLKKDDKDWRVVGMPDVKVNSKAVTDTLDALAGLKVERWLIDHNAEVQLYGLQPPQLTIDIQTSTGKRTLLIGRNEQDSARRYAAVAGETAVFVMSEDDVRRIVRSLAAFVESK